MKKRKAYLAIIAIVALIVLLITGYTYSKYHQSVKGRGVLSVAAWSFRATTNNNKPLSEIVLTSQNGEPVLPGSRGTFEITVDATGSDIDIAYTTKVTNENFPQSMIFYNASEDGTRYEDFKDYASSHLKGTLSPTSAQKVTHIVGWEWPYVEGELDTTVNSNYGFDVEVVGEQVK